MFDVLAPDSPQPEDEFRRVLADYPAAILTGDYADRAGMMRKLLKWVKGGGELVAPAAIAAAVGLRPGERRKVGKGSITVSSSPWMLPEQHAQDDVAMREVFIGKTKEGIAVIYMGEVILVLLDLFIIILGLIIYVCHGTAEDAVISVL